MFIKLIKPTNSSKIKEIINCVMYKICINSWLSISNSCPNCRHKWKKNPFITYYKKSYLEELEKRLFYESIGLQINNYLIQ